MFRIIGSILLFLVFLTALVLAWLNTGVVEIRYLLGTININLSFALFMALLFGWILGLATSLLFIFRLRRELARARKDVKMLEAEVNNLRSIPIRDAH